MAKKTAPAKKSVTKPAKKAASPAKSAKKATSKKAKEVSKERIFVQIPAYRDPECQWTVRDLFEKAKHPERIFVGICWQVIPEEDQHCFLFETRPKQVRNVWYHALDARGLGWARYCAQQLWQGEEYTLQIDSHMRFPEGWDEDMINELRACPSDKAVLSCSPARYTPPDHLQENPLPCVRHAKILTEGGDQRFGSKNLYGQPDRPVLGAFIAGGFIFGPSQIITDVPSDPVGFFTQEEINIAARLWTHGWDIYHPHKQLIYHFYDIDRTQEMKPKKGHWHDNRNWVNKNILARQRFFYLFGIDKHASAEALQDIDKYGFGTERSFEEYQQFCGINFARKEYSKKALEGLFDPEIEKFLEPVLSEGQAAPIKYKQSTSVLDHLVYDEEKREVLRKHASDIILKNKNIMPVHAPVLIIPDAFPLEFCKELIHLFDTGEVEEGSVAGKDEYNALVIKKDKKHKVRRDYWINDPHLRRRINTEFDKKIFPEIKKVFNLDATRSEKYVVGCYGEEDGGFFRAHRDNDTENLEYRQLAVSLNLNDDYEGGYLNFPEYGDGLYKPGAGGVAIFPCSLFHQATDVTKGHRYMFLSFLYGEDGAEIRKKICDKRGVRYPQNDRIELL